MSIHKIPKTFYAFAEDLINYNLPQQFEVDKNIRVIGKFQQYFIYAWNKIIKGKLITTAYVKFENSLKIHIRMKNLIQQQIFKLNGYTKVGFFMIKKGQIMYRICQNITNQCFKAIILENVISSNDAIINSIIQKYYVFFFPYLFEINLPQHYQMVGMKSQAQFIQSLEDLIKSYLKDFSKSNNEIIDSLILGQPNIQEIYIHGDKDVLDNKESLVKFNFFNSQSDIYETKLLFIHNDSYINVLQKTNSPFLETIFINKYTHKHYREKNQHMLSLHQLILNNRPLSIFRRLQIVRDVCEGIKCFKYHQKQDLMQSQKFQQNVESTEKEYLQIKIINPLTIMITPQLCSFILIWPYQNDDNKAQKQYQNFQYRENNQQIKFNAEEKDTIQYVKFNTLEKHTIYSIGKLLSLFFQSKLFLIEGPSFFIESIKTLIHSCQNNSNITIQSVVNILNLLQKYLDQFD